jgi:hypothetical protein
MKMTGILPGMAVLGMAALLGALVADAFPFPIPVELPPVALFAAVLVLAALPFLVGRWMLTLGIFLVWLVVEDLVRKLAGNNLAVYFVKDLIYFVLLFALFTSASLQQAWRRATGKTRLFLYALVCWAVIMVVPTIVDDWRLPMVGLRLDFLYVPLVVAGYLLVQPISKLQQRMVALSILGGAASAVGIAQAILGPGFLAPPEPTPGLINIDLVRGLAGSAPVLRPTGTFVDPGRFSSVAVLALAVGLATLLIVRGGRRGLALASVLAAAGAVWVSGGRTSFVVGACLVALGAVASAFGERHPALGRAGMMAALGLGAIFLFSALVPDLFTSRLAWYTQTLDPRSSENEWSFRWDSYGGDTRRGIDIGGLIGQGTGSESLGKQYLYGDSEGAPAGSYQVEGGYASIAVEWGAVGLALWTLWTLAWLYRQWRCIRAAPSGKLRAMGLVLWGWMIFFLIIGFFGGLQGYQNYIPNAYFWLLSGVIFGLPQLAASAEEKLPQGGLVHG